MGSDGMNQRNGTVDTFRLLYALVIMTGHLVIVGVQSPFPFEPVGILVEFFFMLTGYYTCSHFTRQPTLDNTKLFTRGLRYTFRKFKVFFPFLLVSVLLRYSIDIVNYCTNWGGTYRLAKALENALEEMILAKYMLNELPQRVGALYFLSAMFFVFPAFCVLCQLKNKSVILGISVYAMVFYYHDIDRAITADYPQVLLRAFCGMSIGAVIFYVVEWLNKSWTSPKRACRSCFYAMALFILLIPLFFSGLHIVDRRIPLYCEFFGLILLLSNISRIGKHHGIRLTSFFARFSMALYIMHYAVGTIINYYCKTEVRYKVMLFYLLSFVSSAILLWIVGAAKKKLPFHKIRC